MTRAVILDRTGGTHPLDMVSPLRHHHEGDVLLERKENDPADIVREHVASSRYDPVNEWVDSCAICVGAFPLNRYPLAVREYFATTK